MPQMESNQIAMTLETEEGSSLDDTAKVADQVMDRIGKIEDIKDIGGLVSASDMMGTQTESNVIEFYAITKDHPSLDNGQLKKKICLLYTSSSLCGGNGNRNGYDRGRKGEGDYGQPSGISDQDKFHRTWQGILPDDGIRHFLIDLCDRHGDMRSDHDGL